MQFQWEESHFVPFLDDKDQASSPGLSLIQYDSTYSQNNYKFFEINIPDVKREVTLSPDKDELIISEKLGKYNLRLPRTYNFEQYNEIRAKREFHNGLIERAYKERTEDEDQAGGKLEFGTDIAGQRVSLQIGGNINLEGKVESQKTEGSGTARNANSTNFLVEQQQQFTAEGNIGDRITLGIDWDSQRDFDFQNRLKVHYSGKEDEIVQSIDAGNINLSLSGAELITFSPDKSGLMGIKSKMKFGGTNVTAIAGLEKGENSKISLEGGETSQTNTIKDYEYVRKQYFFLDTLFRNNMWKNYWNGDKYTFQSNRLVDDIEVYKSTKRRSEANSFQADAYTDPHNKDESYSETATFQKLERGNDYTISDRLGYIRLTSQISEGKRLAVVYKLDDGTEYGDYTALSEQRQPETLKLLKSRSMGPSDHGWKLMWKNVYSLGVSNVDPDNLTVQIINTASSSGQSTSNSEGTTFLHMLGLDEMKSDGSEGQDGEFDKDRNILRTSRGEIWLPFLKPFQHGDGTSNYKHNPKLDKKYSEPAFYNLKKDVNSDTLRGISSFEIEYETKGRTNVLNLGPMVKEGSVTVTLNGETLQKGVDYNIQYFSGKLTLLNDEATNPNADLEVKYEKNKMFNLSQKTILGARIEREFEKDNQESSIFLGGTAIYYNKSVQEEKVDVSYEPYSNTVLGINGKYEKQLPILTAFLNKIPLIELSKPTTINAEAEVAQVYPNPNTIDDPKMGDNNGVAFIDDFEGSKRTTPIPITRRNWVPSSVPVGKSDSLRGKMVFYNPYNKTETKKIWPEKETSNRQGNNTTTTLNLSTDPEWARAIGDFPEITNSTKRKAWGGILHYFDAGETDFSRSKFIEIWVKGDTGRLHIDLGTISEDINDNGTLDTEGDPTLEILRDGEDTGLDGKFSENEEVKVFYPDGSSKILEYGDEELKHFKRDPEDPHSDDYKYNTGSGDYSQINGMEGNSTGNNKDQQLGKISNTEDRNGNNSPDFENDYVTVEIPLDDDTYLVNETEDDNGEPTGWKLYQVPLRELKRPEELKDKGDFKFNEVEAARIWMDSLINKTNLEIAKMEIVGNDWREKGMKELSHRDSSYSKAKESFGVSVLNNQENSTIYTPPEGVQGEYDKVNKVRKKEQSLALDFYRDGLGLRPGQKAALERIFAGEPLSLLNYKKLKFFLHGPPDLSNDSLKYFLKFGRVNNQTEHMYEIRTTLETGWKEVITDLNFLSSLKSFNDISDWNSEEMGGELIIKRDSSGITQRIFKEKEDGNFTGKELIIHGEPALTRIQTLKMGLMNKGNQPFFTNKNSRVWVNELRVSDVIKESSTALRTQLDVGLGELGGFNVRYNREDGSFHRAEQKSQSTTDGLVNNNNFNISGKINMDQIIPMPEDWGIKLPVSASYENSKGIPDYHPGTDISVKQSSAPDSIINVSRSKGFNTSLSKTEGSDFWLSKYTIDQLNLNYSATWRNNQSLNYLYDRSTEYRGSINYSIPFNKDKKIKIFQWADSIPLIGQKLSNINFHYTPDNFNIKSNAAERIEKSQPRRADTTRQSYNFDLSSTITFDYSMFDALSFNFNRNMDHNLRDYRNDKQEIIQNLISNRSIGVEEQINESYKISFSPNLFNWLKSDFSAQSNYNWSEPYNSTSNYLDELSNKRSLSSSFGLDIAALWGQTFLSTDQEQESTSSRRRGRSTRRRNRSGEQSESQDNQDEENSENPVGLAKLIHNNLKKLQTIEINLNRQRSISNQYRKKGKPPLAYRLGLTNDPELKTDTAYTQSENEDLQNKSRNITLNSGLNLTKNIQTSFSFDHRYSKSIERNQTTQNINKSYLPIKIGEEGKSGLTFPNWRISWNNFQDLFFLKNINFIKSISLNHQFSGQSTTSKKDQAVRTQSYTRNFQPLIGTSIDLQNTISGNLRINRKTTLSSDISGGNNKQLKLSNSFSGSISYTKEGGLNLSLPFMGDKKLDNDITFQMGFSYTHNITKRKKATDSEYEPNSMTKSWNISPSAKYKVSNRVNTSLFLKYSVSDNRRTPKRTNINGGITVNIAIQG